MHSDIYTHTHTHACTHTHTYTQMYTHTHAHTHTHTHTHTRIHKKSIFSCINNQISVHNNLVIVTMYGIYAYCT